MSKDKTAADSIRHGPVEDLLALFVGCVFVATGLAILHAAGLVTGGMAGTALLVSKLVPVSPGLLLAILNLPFIVLGYRAIGPLFALRTVLASAGIAGLSLIGEHTIRLGIESPLVAAIAGGTLLGQGTLCMIRHGTGMGGFGVLTIWLNRKFSWPVGRSQILVDVVVLGLSAAILAPMQLAWSALCALVMGAVVYLWDRPGRYAGMSQMQRQE